MPKKDILAAKLGVGTAEDEPSKAGRGFTPAAVGVITV